MSNKLPNFSYSTHLIENWEAWVALNHFLTVDVLRQLLIEVVREVSDNRFNFSDLFEDETQGNCPELATWIVRPKTPNSEIQEFLQNRIRGIAWSNDSPIHRQLDNTQTSKSLSLDAALAFNRLDLNSSQYNVEKIAKDSIQPTFKNIIDSYSRARESAHLGNAITLSLLEENLDLIPSPLDGIFLKHLGDLLADIDQWPGAYEFYSEANKRLGNANAVWDELTHPIKAIIKQSCATANQVISSVDVAHKEFFDLINDKSLIDFPLQIWNATQDAMSSGFKLPSSLLIGDTRPALMDAPLLIDSHDVSRGALAEIEGDADRAHRIYWATLRRQTALGSMNARKNTQRIYAASLIKASNSNPTKEIFHMGAVLLVDSGNSAAVERIEWKEETINRLVTLELVELLSKKQKSYPGTTIERGKVLATIFGNWLLKIDTSEDIVVRRIIEEIGTIAKGGKSSFYASEDQVTPCLKAFKQIIEFRPEFAQVAAPHVSELLIHILKTPNKLYWTAITGSLELAKLYLEYFSSSEKHTVFEITIALLRDQKLAGMWMVVDAALAILYSPASYQVCLNDSSLGSRIVSAVVSFGVNHEREQAQFIANFRHFPANLIQDDIRAKLDSVIQSVAQGINSNSSNAVGKIHAMILVPELVGNSNLIGAIDALRGLLTQVTIPPHRNFMPELYNPIRALAYQIKTNNIHLDENLELKVNSIVEVLGKVWDIAKLKPSLMASFSIPEKIVPNDAIVHNWALATLEFAESLNCVERIKKTLLDACSSLLLDKGIKMAFGTILAGQSATKQVEIDMEQLQNSTKDAFYSTLGRYLVVAFNSPESSSPLIELLIDKILNYGPREADVAVLLAASAKKISIKEKRPSFENYKRRALSDLKLRTLLQPILYQFEQM